MRRFMLALIATSSISALAATPVVAQQGPLRSASAPNASGVADPCAAKRTNTVLGGALGSIAGGALGSAVAASQVRPEGVILGSVVGLFTGATVGAVATACGPKETYVQSYGRSYGEEAQSVNQQFGRAYGDVSDATVTQQAPDVSMAPGFQPPPQMAAPPLIAPAPVMQAGPVPASQPVLSAPVNSGAGWWHQVRPHSFQNGQYPISSGHVHAHQGRPVYSYSYGPIVVPAGQAISPGGCVSAHC